MEGHVIGQLLKRVSDLESKLAHLEKHMGLEDDVELALKHRGPSITAIKNAVRSRFGNNLMESPSLQQDCVLPRSIAMYLCRKLAGASLPAIGAAFGKHHTTVLHAVQKIEDQRQFDSKLDSMLKAIEAHFTPKEEACA